MTLQSSGIITLSDIQTEFGGSNPINLSEYYRDGIYVPDIPNNSDIPLSGAISLNDFYGAQKAFVATVTEGTRNVDNDVGRGFALANKLLNGASTSFATSDAFGSRTPLTYNGTTIQGLYEYIDRSGGASFVVVLSGARAPSFFTSVDVQGIGLLDTTDVILHNQVSGSTIWKWDIGSDNARWDGSGTSTVTFID